MVRWKKLNLSLRPYKPLLSKSCSLKMMPEVPINANISWFATKPKCIRDSSVCECGLTYQRYRRSKKGPKKHVQKEPLREHFFWQRKLPKHWNLTIMYISRREIKWPNSDHNVLNSIPNCFQSNWNQFNVKVPTYINLQFYHVLPFIELKFWFSFHHL